MKINIKDMQMLCCLVVFLLVGIAFGQGEAEVSAEDNAYLVIDLQTWKHRFTAAPPDLAKDDCLTTELWLRRIPAGKFMMGSPEDEFGRGAEEMRHEVTLTQDFYIGVFECTQGQWERVMGGEDSFSYGKKNGEPVEQSYNAIRGNTLERGGGWPQRGHAVDGGSFMGILREKTGMYFDLPTEAQWEYACRAGKTNAFNSGSDMTYRGDPALNEIGRYRFNQNDGKGGNDTTAKVGSYLPNAWGLYDMHGNVEEWCLDQDKFGVRPDAEDPVGPDGDSKSRIIRGGNYSSYAADCRSAKTSGDGLLEKSTMTGFRIACRLSADTGGTYLVVNLESGQHRFSDEPPDLSNDVCRMGELWLRRIEAGTFTMGAPDDEVGHKDFQLNESRHKVTLTQAYYIGVFECTQKQWELVTSRPVDSVWKNDCLPVERVSYGDIRGISPEAGGGWPGKLHEVDDNSFMGRLRRRTGLEFDLPTEAQWEYACRAGTATAFNSGKNLSYPGDSALDILGRYYENQGQEFTHKGKVGSYSPNAWGLYDMHGNLGEWCLDWLDSNYGEGGEHGSGVPSVTDPVGPRTGHDRVCRGGSSRSHPENCRSAAREATSPSMNVETGFRIVCLLSKQSDINLFFNGAKMTLKPVAAGEFTNTELNKAFSLRHDYWIGETEVTQSQYEAVMKTNPSENKDSGFPVEQVSWNDARMFCEKLNEACSEYLPSGYRIDLPTEAQWEFAARGGVKSSGFQYSGGDDIDKVAWHCGNSGSRSMDEMSPDMEQLTTNGCSSHVVRRKEANELALHDMSGNVWEWCRDVFDGAWRHDPESLEGMRGGSFRVRRGGSWNFDAGYCRPSVRGLIYPSYRGPATGFRVAIVPVQ